MNNAELYTVGWLCLSTNNSDSTRENTITQSDEISVTTGIDSRKIHIFSRTAYI